jgi:hypothetical protein
MWILVGCLADSPDEPPDAAPAVLPTEASIEGPGNPATALGYSLANVGDVDGDGLDDLAAASRAYETVWLLHGSAARTLDATVLRADVRNETASSYTDVYGGDFNGDGLGEVVVATPFSDNLRGRVLVFDAADDWGPTPFDLEGLDAQQAAGSSVVVGDVDGDGVDDLTVGATGFHGSYGGPYISVDAWVRSWRGPLERHDYASFAADPSDAWFGPVHAIGDVDGEGDLDVIIERGVSGDDTWSLLEYHGSADGLAPTANAITVFSTGQMLRGHRVIGPGDVDGDGFDDMLWLASWAGVKAEVSVFPGSPTGLGADPASVIETSVEVTDLYPAGDLDEDGFADVLAVRWYDDQGRGAVDLWRGSPDGLLTTAAATWTGSDRQGHFGNAVATGDFDGDGHPDLAVGAPYAADSRGRITVYYGDRGGWRR